MLNQSGGGETTFKKDVSQKQEIHGQKHEDMEGNGISEDL